MNAHISRTVLTYPQHQFRPEDLLNFVEFRAFTHAWDKDCRFNDDDLAALQMAIMAHPHGGDVIPGTEGLRKMRIRRTSERIGQRGGVRVLYVHLPEFALVLLVYAFKKAQREDLDEEDKRVINHEIRRIKRWLEERRSPLS